MREKKATKQLETTFTGLANIKPINPDEQWKFCTVNNLYLISNYGRVFSLYSNQIIKPYLDRYYKVILQIKNENKQKTSYIHRLVASAWIPNPHGYSEVNHKSEIKTDNRVSNLEWCNHLYNSNYGTKNQRCSKKRKRKINQYNEDWNLLKKWDSRLEAGQFLGVDPHNISYHCKEKNHFYKGYYWLYADADADKN